MIITIPKIKIHASVFSNIIAFTWNILLLYLMYALCRLIFLIDNWDVLSEGFSSLKINNVIEGSLKFDTAAIAYTNLLYALFMLFPLHFRESEIWRKICKYLYFNVNAICLAINLGDTVYFQYD